MTRHVSIVARAVLALGVAVGFYAVAVSVAVGCFWLAARPSLFDSFIPGYSLLPAIAAMVILWAIVPRRARFEPPGPRVTPGEEPALFDLVASLATATRQRMPDDVYFVNWVTASVAQRGGVLGLCGRRVLVLGLPLMQLLTIDELKAVITHEFGHFHAGDLALGPLIHRTRAAMDRTLESVSDQPLEMLFTWYTDWFTRVTSAVSRHQEFVADALAAKVAGTAASRDALRRVCAGHVAFIEYMLSVIAPVVEAGYVPPVMEGFARFMRAAPVVDRMRRALAEAEAEESADANAMHPCLRERLAALRDDAGTACEDPRPSISLLVNLPEWERAALASADAPLLHHQRLEWDRFTECVVIPSWRQVVIAFAPMLKGVTIGSFPHTRRELVAFGGPLRNPDEAPSPGDLAVRAKFLLGSAIALSLLNSGWTADAVLGDDVVFRRAGEELRVFSALDRIDAGRLSMKDWRQRCDELGISAVPLSTAIVAATADDA